MDNPNQVNNINTISFVDVCPICKQIRKTATFFNSEFALMCECEESTRNAERLQNIEKGELLIKNTMRANAGLSKRWIDKSLDSFIPKMGQESAYNAARAFAVDCKTSGGLLLCGVAGSGKTFLSAALANQIIDETHIDPYTAEQVGRFRYNRFTDTTPVRLINTIDMLVQIKSAYDKTGQSSQRILDKYKTADVLILDDLGAELVSSWTLERLFEIINFRYNELLPLVITTNKTPEELKKDYGSRIFDRIREMCYFVPIDTPSQRITATN